MTTDTTTAGGNEPRTPVRQHAWQRIAVGRVCVECRLVQAARELRDDVSCPPEGEGAAQAGPPGESALP